MDRVRTALIGCGKVGQIHAAALKSLPEAEFVAACDADASRADVFASTYGGRGYGDVAKMLREAKPEAALVCTPHPLHAAPTVAAADGGVHVLVEKPLAANLRDCDAMIAAAARASVQLGVISQRRWYEPVQRLKAAIEAGKIGKPALGLFLMYSWREPAYYQSDPWRGRWDTEGGGVLVNQSPHHLDLLRWFMGPVAEVSGYWANINHPTVEVDDTAVASLRFSGGGLGAIITSVAQRPGIYAKIHVHGSNGASVGVETDRGATFIAGMTGITEPPVTDIWTIPGEENLLAHFQAGDRDRFRTMDPLVHYHALQIRDFLQAIRQGRPPRVTGADGRAVVEMFTAIYQSNRERRPIALPLAGEDGAADRGRSI